MGVEEAYNGSSKSDAVILQSMNKVNDIAPPSYEEATGREEIPTNESKAKEQPPMVGVLALFRFADKVDWLLMAIGTLMALANGVAMPSMIIIFGEVTEEFVSSKSAFDVITKNSTHDPRAKMLDNMKSFSIYFVALGIAVWVVSYGQMAAWGIAAERQARKIRNKLYYNILRQHIGWFDTHDIGELNNRLTDDVNKIKEGMGDKVGAFFQFTSMALTGFIIGFAYGWKLTLVILSISPLMAVGAYGMTMLLATLTSSELKAYAQAGAVAEEVLGAIRTVAAFGGQDKECTRYSSRLYHAYTKGVKKGLINGLGLGFVWFVMLGAYGLAFWYGGKLVREEEFNVGKILIVFFSVLFGAFALGSAAPNLQALSVGRGAAFAVYGIIDEVSEIDSFSEVGQKLENCTGNIQLNNIHFTYPSRKEVKVLNNLSLRINVGERVALVGPSGCGKSTVVQLIQRFYDPDDGEVIFDGVNIKHLNLGWLRERIGVVSQEPILFGTTIAENLRFGRLDVTQEEMVDAAKEANAHNFILELPDKYETLVGERGAQLSGGQKQRIAIARALVRNPTILLLDEATSALDNESEAIVQEALDKASTGRTTVVIAHRLSTIHGADRIIAIKDGQIAEEGTHDELMGNDGLYATLVKAQLRSEDDDEFDEINLQSAASVKHKQLERMLSVKSITSASTLEQESDKEEVPEPSMKRVFALNSPEWLHIVVGTIAAFLGGAVQPIFALILGKALFVFAKEEELNKYCLGFVGLAFIVFFAFFLQGYLYGISGEKLTMRVRQLAFKAMLHQEISWFDDHKNSTGALCTRLATDASLVQGATGARIGTLIQQMGSMLVAIAIAFYYDWAMTLVILAFVPFIMLSGYIQMIIMTGNALQNKGALEAAGKVAVESVGNIRTVASLTREHWFYNEYMQKLTNPYKSAIKKSHFVGVGFGFSQGILFMIYAAAFYFGAWRVENGKIGEDEVFIVFMALVFGAMAAGQASSFAPDYGKARASAGCIFQLLDHVPVINSNTNEGEKPDEGSFTSLVQFNDVKFEYPTRKHVKVLRGLTLQVNPGETVALVGSSGCGKSTVIQMIERFYDPREGAVKLDEHDLTSLNVQWLRSQIGIVSQEPVLFDCSISENIKYGDNSRDVPIDEVIAAARNANIHSFIDSLPLKYDTNVGAKGTQLSGGQKQRVAIARALVRNPKILLLDEATSALDTESERVVQEALDKAREGRTCIVIAHRLSTIQNADRIFVIRYGVVTEDGTHADLMANRKFYYKLQMTQNA